jgi:hypothetical protein
MAVFFIVFRPFGSDCITAAFHRIVNERKQSDTRLSDRLRPVYGHRNVGPGHSYPAFDRYSQWKTYTLFCSSFLLLSTIVGSIK